MPLLYFSLLGTEPWIDDFHVKQMDFPSCFSIVNGGALGGKKSKGRTMKVRGGSHQHHLSGLGLSRGLFSPGWVQHGSTQSPQCFVEQVCLHLIQQFLDFSDNLPGRKIYT